MEKIIFHVDVNSAFLSWEAVYRMKHLGCTQDLRDIPSAVCGDIKKRHGIILAKSVPAKKYGIQTGETIGEALKKCPTLELVQPHYNLYETSSKAFIEILKEYTPDVEKYSIDECYMDMTGTQSLFGAPVVVANLIKDRIYKELGFTVNIGVSNNKLLAKMAGDFKKPNLVHTLFPDEVQKKFWHLPVSELFFVGRATTKKLFSLGIRTIGELAKADVNMLRAHLNKHGEVIWNFANGIDVSVVEPPPARKGYGNSTTIAFDVTDEVTAKMVLLALAESVSACLRKDNVKAEVIAVSIKDFEFHHCSHQMTLFSGTNVTNEIHAAACQLFDESWSGEPIRNLGIHTSRIVADESERQLTLFDNNRFEKLEKMDQAIDRIRSRYGIDAVKRATFLECKIDHMSGGISRDKKTVDYKDVNLK
jgi:DNA polymerase-4